MQRLCSRIIVRHRTSSKHGIAWGRGRRAAAALEPVRFLSAGTTGSNEDDDQHGAPPEQQEWLPPDRPLVGDKGHSHEYTHIAASDKDTSDGGGFTDDWIPPDRPLVGDKGNSHVFSHVEEQVHLKRLEKELEQLELRIKTDKDEPPPAVRAKSLSTTADESTVPDWLKTRRAVLEGSQMVKPGQEAALAKEKLLDTIEVKKHTLLNLKEITTVLESLGGQDVVCVLDNPAKPRMTGVGIVITTGQNHPQIRILAESLRRQLRLRNLEDMGVIGAQDGIEGNVGDPNEDWLVLDCENYVVHFQTPSSRAALNLEGLWSGLDGTHKLDLADEDAVDEYIARNPVPEWYTAGASPIGIDWYKQVKNLKKSRFTRGASSTGGFRKRQRGRRR